MQAGVPFAASHSHAACGQRHTHTCHGGDAIYQWQFPQGARAITSPRNLPSAHSVLGNGMVKDATLCFAQARALLPQILQRSGATIRLVTSTLSNVGRFSNCTGLQPAQVLTVHSRDAFPRSFEEHRDAYSRVLSWLDTRSAGERQLLFVYKMTARDYGSPTGRERCIVSSFALAGETNINVEM